MSNYMTKMFSHEIQEKRIRDFLVETIRKDLPPFIVIVRILEWNTRIIGPQNNVFIDVWISYTTVGDDKTKDEELVQMVSIPFTEEVGAKLFF